MPDPGNPTQPEMEGVDVALAPAYAEARAYLERAKAPGTLRAYRADWRHFATWCAERGREVLPAAPDTLALYLTELARDHHVSTLTRRLAAIDAAHAAAGYDSPAAAPGGRTLMAGIRRVKGTAPATQKKPLLVADLERVVTALPENLLGARDAALLLVGFAGKPVLKWRQPSSACLLDVRARGGCAGAVDRSQRVQPFARSLHLNQRQSSTSTSSRIKVPTSQIRVQRHCT